MTTQPEALRLADLLENGFDDEVHLLSAASAAELRRLVAQRDALLEALRDMVSDHASLSAATLAFARAAIKSVEE